MKSAVWQRTLSGILGLSLLVAAAFASAHTWQFIKTAQHATGIVTIENAGCAHTEVSFRTASGETVDYPQNGEVCLHPGQKVNVLYDPSMPRGAAGIDTFGALWFFPGFPGLFAVIFLVAATGSRLIEFRHGR